MRRKIVILSICFLFPVAAAIALLPLIPVFKLLGFDRPKEYIVLFQNNMELRPTGGFLGSFARIRVDRANPTLLKIEDIYTPDGQLDGHVDPPWPIQAAFGQGWFKLRDSNWDPDFPSSAKTITWFFEHGNEPPSDGLVAVNLSLLENLLRLTGPVYVLDEPEKITAENFYKRTQAAVEDGFFPGSVQKRDFLSKLGQSVFSQALGMPLSKKLQLPELGWQLLKEKQILVYSKDADSEQWLHSAGFDGSLRDIRGSNTDYLAIFESNLGANKANCCIKRDIKLSKQAVSGQPVHILKIHYENTNPSSLKQPPLFWGGAYVNFLRVGIPIDAKVISIKVGDTNLPVPNSQVLGDVNSSVTDFMQSNAQDIRKFITGEDVDHLRVDLQKKDDKGTQFLGFFVLVDALDSKDVEVQYSTANSGKLYLERQSGDPNFRPISGTTL